jgi:hypothetical protein
MELVERPATIGAGLPPGQPVDVSGSVGTIHQEGDVTVVAFLGRRTDVTVRTSLGRSEALKVANSLG